MATSFRNPVGSLLVMVAGVKGAVGSTVAAAAELLRRQPEMVSPWLTTCGDFDLGPCPRIICTGWDIMDKGISEALSAHAVLPKDLLSLVAEAMDAVPIKTAPNPQSPFNVQVARLISDIREYRSHYPDALPVLVNLLPAGPRLKQPKPGTLSQLYETIDPALYPDLTYALAAVESGIPIVNFTPNEIEIPAILSRAAVHGVPLTGRDGKTGQTYFKVVLASALRVRGLTVDGWYSLNILGNADGKNLMDPDRAAGKVANKTNLLNTILGYSVGERYGMSTHAVRIDYYPPRGDAKEAWDVIDFKGLFGLPMSLRVNLLGRDSILAAPMVIDLARWLVLLKAAGRSGPVPELGLYFKTPVGDTAPVTFQDQVRAVEKLYDLYDGAENIVD